MGKFDNFVCKVINKHGDKHRPSTTHLDKTAPLVADLGFTNDACQKKLAKVRKIVDKWIKKEKEMQPLLDRTQFGGLKIIEELIEVLEDG